MLAALLHSGWEKPDGERKPMRNECEEAAVAVKTLCAPLDPALTKAKSTLANELYEPIHFLCAKTGLTLYLLFTVKVF